MEKENVMLNSAIEYAKKGLAVFPCNGKEPAGHLVPNGCKNATTDIDKITSWWTQYPKYNIGIATGKPSGGVFVIDIDRHTEEGKEDGYESLREWEKENGELPEETWKVVTGSGGYHIYFKTDKLIGNRVNILESVDIRGTGGYVIAPPSIHPDTKRSYEWEYAPEDTELAQATELVYKFLSTGRKSMEESFKAPVTIPKGERNDILFKTACMMQAKGMSDRAIYYAVQAENMEKCKPEVDKKELKKIIESVLNRYEKGKPISSDLEEVPAPLDGVEDYKTTSVANHLQEFINGITHSVNTPCIPTGNVNLDKVLDGGLYEGLYIIGAISSLGKTTLITQIADQIAQRGTDILIFSLEMARSELMAKSISRHTFIDVINNNGKIQNAKTTRGITVGARYAGYNEEEVELIKRSITAYSEYAENIYIHEGLGNIGVKQIREIVDTHIQATGKKPVVIIDYLQILSPADIRATDKQNTDKAVMELKRISRDYKLPVIGISSFNRDNYNTAVNMRAFKESGAIEYSSDVLLGLQLTGAGGTNFDENTAKKKNPREVELVILKNRNGATGDKIKMEYYPLFNYFTEI